MPRCAATEGFSRLRLQQMIDPRHLLVVRAVRMPWQQTEVSVAHRFHRQGRAGVSHKAGRYACAWRWFECMRGLIRRPRTIVGARPPRHPHAGHTLDLTDMKIL